MGLPNPWVLLGSILGVIGISAVCYLQGERAQAAKDKVQAQAIAIEQAQAIANEQARSHGKEIEAEATVAHQRDDYEDRLKKQNDALAATNDTIRKLRDAYNSYSCSSSMPQTTGVPLSNNQAIGSSCAEMAEFGRQAASTADSCQSRLTACEQWSQTVIRETGQTP
jgi:hypothetical protein